MDCIRKECALCKKIIDNTSNHISISYDNGYAYFHRFCYFNYRTEILK